MGKDLLMLIVFGVMLLAVGIFYLYDKSKKNTPAKSVQVKGTEETKIQGVKRVEKPVEQKTDGKADGANGAVLMNKIGRASCRERV